MPVFAERFAKRNLSQRIRKDYDRELHIDIETYSSYDLKKCGLHRYVTSPEFEILLFGYAFDNEPVKVVDLANFEDLPDDVAKALTDQKVLKTAWNAQFEFTCIEKHFNIKMDIGDWECSMIRAANLSLPLGLDAAAQAMKATFQKDPAGKALIKYYCLPCAPTKVNDMRTRNFPHHRPEKWEDFKKYCATDVYTERAISTRMDRLYFITQFERDLYALDQKINKTGVRIDRRLVDNAIAFDTAFRAERIAEAQKLTGLQNPNAVAKLKGWLNREMELDEDEEIESLKKADVEALLKQKGISKIATRVLQIRQSLGKSSVSKYTAMSRCADIDDRIRGLFQFYGAQRTGRWAGRLVQMQNLPKNDMALLDYARSLVLDGDLDFMQMMYDNIPATLSQLVRTAFIPGKGKKFSVLDFSAIEACVLAWIAGEQWRIKVFREGGDIYLASAARMFNVDIKKQTAAYEAHEQWAIDLRQQGKVAELALGYGGSDGAIATMDTKKKIDPEDRHPLVDAWRAANPAIAAFWKSVNNAAIHCIKTGETVRVGKHLVFKKVMGTFFIVLPSGRHLTYLQPRIGKNKWDGDSVLYKGQNQKTNKWEDLETYGGKLTENIIQAISRDLLGNAMLNIDAAGFDIVAHVHDEVLVETDENENNIPLLSEIMTVPVTWAEGLPLSVKGFETMYYKKD